MKNKKTLVLGATTNPERYAYLALNRLLENGHEVIAVGKKEGEVAGVTIHSQPLPFEGVDTVTLYLNPTHQQAYYDYIIGLQPKRVIFNPGTENPGFYQLLQDNGIDVEVACTLVLLATNQY